MILAGPFAEVVNPATGRRVREAWPREAFDAVPRVVWLDPAERPDPAEARGGPYTGVAWYASAPQGPAGEVLVMRLLARRADRSAGAPPGALETAMPTGGRFVFLRVRPRPGGDPPLLLSDPRAEPGARVSLAEYTGVVAPLVARLAAAAPVGAARANPARRRRNPAGAADDTAGARLTLEHYDPPRRGEPTSGAYLTWVDPRPRGWIERGTVAERAVVVGAMLALFVDRAARPPRLRAWLTRGPFGPRWRDAAGRAGRAGAYDGPHDPIAVAVAGCAAPRTLAVELDAATLAPTADALRELGVAGWLELAARTPFAAMLARLAELGAVRDLVAPPRGAGARANPAPDPPLREIVIVRGADVDRELWWFDPATGAGFALNIDNPAPPWPTYTVAVERVRLGPRTAEEGLGPVDRNTGRLARLAIRDSYDAMLARLRRADGALEVAGAELRQAGPALYLQAQRMLERARELGWVARGPSGQLVMTNPAAARRAQVKKSPHGRPQHRR